MEHDIKPPRILLIAALNNRPFIKVINRLRDYKFNPRIRSIRIPLNANVLLDHRGYTFQ